MLLPPDDVGDAEEVVVDGAAEVVEGPDPVPGALSGVLGGGDPQRGPVPHGRVGVVDLSLHPDDGVPLVVRPLQHLPPSGQVLLGGQVPARAGL